MSCKISFVGRTPLLIWLTYDYKVMGLSLGLGVLLGIDAQHPVRYRPSDHASSSMKQPPLSLASGIGPNCLEILLNCSLSNQLKAHR